MLYIHVIFLEVFEVHAYIQYSAQIKLLPFFRSTLKVV